VACGREREGERAVAAADVEDPSPARGELGAYEIEVVGGWFQRVHASSVPRDAHDGK
jgi:hypothetical protein